MKNPHTKSLVRQIMNAPNDHAICIIRGNQTNLGYANGQWWRKEKYYTHNAYAIAFSQRKNKAKYHLL